MKRLIIFALILWPKIAYAEVVDGKLHMRAVSFLNSTVRRAEAGRSVTEAVELGRQIAQEIKG